MFVNKPKFQRDGNKVAETSVALNKRTATKTMEPVAHKQLTHQVPTSKRIKSCVEVVTNRKLERYLNGPFSSCSSLESILPPEG